MNASKRARLQNVGWRVGSTKEFLGLTDEEAAFAELKLRLAQALAARRKMRRLTQVRAARLLGSSQSRVAKMETADATVSADLLIRSLLKLGATPKDLARAIGA